MYDWTKWLLGLFPGAKKNEKSERHNWINYIAQHDNWLEQAVICAGIDFKPFTFKQAINMFYSMDILENIYEGVFEPSYKAKKLT